MRRAALVLLLIVAPAHAADRPRLDPDGNPLPAGAVARLGSIERRHDHLRRFHFAPDGKTFHATARGPAWVQFDTATGKRIRVVQLPGLDGSWPWVSADGSAAVVEQPGQVCHVVEVATGKVQVELPPWASFQNFHEPLSPNGRYIAAADQKHTAGVVQTLHVWDTKTGKTWPLGSHNDGIVQVCFSPDGSRVVVIGQHATSCWDVVGRRQFWRHAIQTYSQKLAVFHPDGKSVVRIGQEGSRIVILDAETGEPAGRMKQPSGVTWAWHAIGFTADGSQLLAHVNADGTAGTKFWDIKNGKWRSTLLWDVEGPLSPDGKFLLVPRVGEKLDCIDVATGKSLYPDLQKFGHTRPMSDVIFDPSGRRVYTAAYDSSIRGWDADDGKLVTTFGQREALPLNRSWGYLAITPDGNRVLQDERGGGGSFTYRLFDPRTGALVRDVGIPDSTRGGNYSGRGRPHLSADGLVIHASVIEDVPADRTVSWRAQVQAWSLTTRTGIRTRTVPVDRSTGPLPAPISPDGRLVSDGNLVCDTVTGRVSAKLADPGFRGFGVPSFSDDGRFLAVRCTVGRNALACVWVWDILHAKVVGRVTVGADHMKLTPDGRFLVTLDASGVSAWDVASGRQLVHHKPDPRRFQFEGVGHTTALAVAPDGKLAATARYDGTALVWDMAGAHVLALNPHPLTAADLTAAWAAFTDPNAGDAFGLMWRLVDRPAATVPFLREKVRAAVVPYTPPDVAAVRAAVAELDDEDFATREAAQKRLGGFGETARPVMVEVLRTTKSVEQRTRLTALLTRLDAAPLPQLRPDEAGLSWALAVLERVGGAEARAAVREVAAGPPGSRLTREAAAALERMGK